MPAKKQNKSRTSKSKANKKVSAPRWVIVVVLLIVAGTGAFLVYQSFAGFQVYCQEGRCQTTRFNRGGYTTYNSSSCYYSFELSNYICGHGSSKRR